MTETEIRHVLCRYVSSNAFAVCAPLRCEWDHVAGETLYWEEFRGRVLDRGQTREQRRFEAWRVWDRTETESESEPIVAVRWDQAGAKLFVTRGVLCRAWEARSDVNGAILSCPVIKRVRELVGTIFLDKELSLATLESEIDRLLHQAVLGTSRLPLTSVESPLPEFATGNLMYFGVRELAEVFADDDVRTSWLQFNLRSAVLPGDLAALASVRDLYGKRWPQQFIGDLARILNDSSLTPWTGWLERLMQTLLLLERNGQLPSDVVVDFLSAQLRLLWRHLNAFDLVRFHHRGANYPDAIWMDMLLRELAQRSHSMPELFLSRSQVDREMSAQKRRCLSLLSGRLLFERYRGHPVPDQPTSPGENVRVLKFGNAEPVPDAQIQDATQRARRLFDSEWPRDAISPEVWRVTIADLADSSIASELGKALFLDRPFGIGKRAGEPDRTPLFSYVAYSCQLARRWLRLLANLPGLDEAIESTPSPSIFGTARPGSVHNSRPGVACLEDAHLVASDFGFTSLTSRSRRELAAYFDFSTAPAMLQMLLKGPSLLMRSPKDPTELVWYDANSRLRAALRWNPEDGLSMVRGVELPKNGVFLVRRWDYVGQEEVLSPPMPFRLMR